MSGNSSPTPAIVWPWLSGLAVPASSRRRRTGC
ncbi:PTPA-CTERM sorting domain-containing protein [Methylococcus sp. EFPC2]|nr:PTPA-CTERM sorting domain-containing protein [Methylococcus sp. EFPC2]